MWWSGTKLSEDCCRYGADNSQNINENVLAKAAAIYGDARKHVEKEQEDFNKLLSSQVGSCIYYGLNNSYYNISKKKKIIITNAFQLQSLLAFAWLFYWMQVIFSERKVLFIRQQGGITHIQVMQNPRKKAKFLSVQQALHQVLDVFLVHKEERELSWLSFWLLLSCI